jgi:hypothetical protein
MAVDAKGNVYIADTDNQRVRRVGPEGVITTFAGGTGPAGAGGGDVSGDGELATQSHLRRPMGVAVDAEGGVYIADADNARVRHVGPEGIISTFSGTGKEGFSGDGGLVAQAALNRPSGVAVDVRGVVYISDRGNHRIRRVIPTRVGVASPDFDGNGAVDFDDFFAFASVFGQIAMGDNVKFDLDGDDVVGFGDFFAFAAEFGKKTR